MNILSKISGSSLHRAGNPMQGLDIVLPAGGLITRPYKEDFI